MEKPSITEILERLAEVIELSLPVVCNASHRVRISSANGGLMRAGGSPSCGWG